MPFLPPGFASFPVISIPEPAVDFGDVFKGEKLRHGFTFENRGGAQLAIRSIRPKCGCVYVKWDMTDKVLSPGAKGSIDLEIDTSRMSGRRWHVPMEITCNDPRTPSVNVFFRVNIRSVLKFKPERPRLEWVRGTEPGHLEITLTIIIEETVKIREARSKSGRLNLKLEEIQPESAYKLLVEANNFPSDKSYLLYTLT